MLCYCLDSFVTISIVMVKICFNVPSREQIFKGLWEFPG